MPKRIPPARARRLRTQTKSRDRAVERAERAFTSAWVELAGEARKLLEEWITQNASALDASPLVTDAIGREWVHERIARLFSSPRDWRRLFGRIAEQLDEDVIGILVRTVPTVNRATLLGAPRTAEFAQRNADLITNVSGLLQERVAGFFTRVDTLSASGALHVEGMTQALQKEFAIGEARAKLWARDQTLKLHGQITQERYAQAGIGEYIWTSSGDERVREIHGELDGTRQRLDDPPVISEDGRRGHPGDDYQCRCTMYPVLS